MGTIENTRLTVLLFYAYVLVLVFFAFQILQPFLVPLGWAGMLALCLWPLQTKLVPRLGNTRSALVVTLLAALLIISPILWLSYALVAQASHVLVELPNTLLRVENMDKIKELWERVSVQIPLPPLDEVRGRIANGAGTAASMIATQATDIVQNVVSVFGKTVIAFLALFFFLRDGAKATAFVRNLLPFSSGQKSHLIHQTRELIFSGITATLVIALAQGCLGGVVFALLGLKAPAFWGLCMFVCAMIPLVGTSLIWGPAAALLLIEGDWMRGAILLGCGFGVIGLLDNLLRPILLHGKAPMNGLLMFLSILGGIFSFGFIGLILGPVVMAAAISLMGLMKAESGQMVTMEEELNDGYDH